MDVLEKVIQLNKIMDDLDNFDGSIPDLQQEIDYKVSDLYHYLENTTMDSKKSYRFCKELKKILLERRQIKNNIAISNSYSSQKQKFMSGADNRKIALSAIGKTKKQLESTYKYRIYTEEQIKEIMEGDNDIRKN